MLSHCRYPYLTVVLHFSQTWALYCLVQFYNVIKDKIMPFRLLFFFSSRRRHTRFSRDWSSDVCSSDLVQSAGPGAAVFVLNEVLANPSGPEPQQEWVEILNAGNVAASLSGYRLKDSG